MNNIKLSKRLNQICQLVDKKRVADIGCDHGKVIAKLFEQHKIEYAYLGDISKLSLEKATMLLGHKFDYDYDVADGLTKIKNQYNIEQCIIAGMGGNEIINIIKNSNCKIENYILSPQKDQIKLKQFLIDNDYMIQKDYILKDGNKFYNIIKCKIGKSNLDDFYIKFGKHNFDSKNKDFMLYLIEQKNKILNRMDKFPNDLKLQAEQQLQDIQKAIVLMGE